MNRKEKKKEEIGNEVKEVKKKKHILRKVLLGILIFVILVVGFFFIRNKLNDINTKKVSNNVSEISKDRVDYVFIDINPSLVLTVKDNQVTDVACLNDDCVSFYNEIDVKGKGINDSIENIYNLVKSKGFDTSKGVNIKITGALDIENKDYVTVEYINENTKDELLSNIKNNEEIKYNNNDDYYSKLWDELKKDKDYDKTYSCNMNNKELECYIILDSGINKDSDYDINNENDFNKIKNILFNSSNEIFDTLIKFGIVVNNNKAVLNGMEYEYSPLFTLNGKPYKNVLTSEIIETFDNDVCEQGFLRTENGKCEVNDGLNIILLDKLNLVNPILNEDNLIINRLGMKDSVLNDYEIMKDFNKENEESKKAKEEKEKLEEEEKIKKRAEMEKISNKRDELISQGYILNREETNERCTNYPTAGLCEYLCLYKKDENGFTDSSLGTIKCEFILYQD